MIRLNVEVIGVVILQVDGDAVQFATQGLIGIQEANHPVLDQGDALFHIHSIFHERSKYSAHSCQVQITGTGRTIRKFLIHPLGSGVYITAALAVEIHTDIDPAIFAFCGIIPVTSGGFFVDLGPGVGH